MPTVARRPGVPRLLGLALILAGILGPLMMMEARPALAAGATTTTYLNLRSGPRTDQRIRLVMPPGAWVEVIGGPRRGFYKVVYNGRPGWAHGDYLDFGGGSSGGSSGGSGTATVFDGALNLRSGPGTNYSVILVMPDRARVQLTGNSSNGFLEVIYQGTRGWASAQYLDTGTGVAEQPSSSLPTGSGGGTATTTTGLNLRAGPSTADRVLLVMPAGATVQLTGDQQNGFLGVIYNGQRGWAYGDYLRTGGGSSRSNSGSGNIDGSDGWSQDEIIAIIYAAADRYGQPREDMLRVARCESGLNPNAVGAAPYYASGLFQFLRSTWATTPYANEDIFDPVANANAAAWMWSVGRRNEWVCQ
ncbi:MAG TPA: SH3 domain-containing protein [Thermomicrobiales bacterium]